MKDRTLPQREKKRYIFKMSLNKQAIYWEDRQLWTAANILHVYEYFLITRSDDALDDFNKL